MSGPEHASSCDSCASFTYQMTAFFGIFYPAQEVDSVKAICKTDPRYKKLASSDAEMPVGRTLLFASTNSDIEDQATVGFIAVDDMTFEGPEYSSAEQVELSIEPAELEKRERKYKKEIKYLVDLHRELTKKLPDVKMKLGWKVLSCAWNLSSSSDDSWTDCVAGGGTSVDIDPNAATVSMTNH